MWGSIILCCHLCHTKKTPELCCFFTWHCELTRWGPISVLWDPNSGRKRWQQQNLTKPLLYIMSKTSWIAVNHCFLPPPKTWFFVPPFVKFHRPGEHRWNSTRSPVGHFLQKFIQFLLTYTPPKFDIAPEKWWLEDYFPIGKVTFQGLC